VSHCKREDVDSLRKRYWIADVSRGVALVASAVGAYLSSSRP
jgi:hypothetical protein